MDVVGVQGVVGIGIDAVDVDRFRRVLSRRPRLAERLFTDTERADAAGTVDPAERLAARFAAKEAVMKALGQGLGSFALRDVEVVRTPGTGSAAGAPNLRLSARAAQLAGARRVSRWHVSLTHTDRLAMAMVVAEAAPPPPAVPPAPPPPAPAERTTAGA
jgi:holo-[acyl-carrier protein] synthase